MVEQMPIPRVPKREYSYDWNRILSGLLALAWLCLCLLVAGMKGLLLGALQIVLPLACVWFPEELGSITTSFPGLLSMVPINRTSPGCLVRLVGWAALLILTVGWVLIVIVGVVAP